MKESWGASRGMTDMSKAPGIRVCDGGGGLGGTNGRPSGPSGVAGVPGCPEAGGLDGLCSDGVEEGAWAVAGAAVRTGTARRAANKRHSGFRGNRVDRDSPCDFDAALEKSLGYKDDVVGP